jgi:hypothetical protein
MAATASSTETKLVAMSNSSLESTDGLRPSAHGVPASCALEESVYDLRLGYARELNTTLGKASYKIPERLTGPLGARPLVPGVPRAHVCALEVPRECAD